MRRKTKLDGRVREAVRHFWATRSEQAKKQGEKTGTKDAGARAAVTSACATSEDGRE